MRQAGVWGLAVAGMVLAFGLGGSPAQAQMPPTFADLADEVGPAVVNIRASQTIGMPRFGEDSPLERFNEFYDEFEQPQSAAGSGFVIDPTGVVVTNQHVIDGADQLEVTFSDGRSFVGDLIGEDEDTDLAVIQLRSSESLPFVNFGDPAESRVGDWVVAIGNPLGIGSTLTVGVISGRDRNISFGAYDNFIQTDAAINPGNSGGPLFNMDGEVIGVNSAIISPTGASVGLGFAIPSDLARTITDRLRRDGTIRRGSLGVRIQAVDSRIAQAYGLERPRGALISSVTADGPAAAAGLEPGDLVVAINGRTIDNERQLSTRVAEAEIGDFVELEFIRDGATATRDVEVEERTNTRPQIARSVFANPIEPGGAATALGVSVASVTPDTLRSYRAYDEADEGVVITYVDPASDAANYVDTGFIIVEIDEQPVRSPQAAARIAGEAALEDGPILLQLITPRGDTQFVAVLPVLDDAPQAVADEDGALEEPDAPSEE